MIYIHSFVAIILFLATGYFIGKTGIDDEKAWLTFIAVINILFAFIFFTLIFCYAVSQTMAFFMEWLPVLIHGGA